MIGAPSLFTPELAKRITDLLAEGNSLAKIGKMPDMPCAATLYNWLLEAERNPEKQELRAFLDSYLRARDAQADLIFDECLDIIDSATNEDITVAKERVNTRMRMAGKLKPKKYGEATQIKHADADGNKIEEIKINVISSKP